MVFYIIYNRSFNDNSFKIWLNHYMRTGLEYKIIVSTDDTDFFSTNYPLNVSKMTKDIPETFFEITINDFLFTYDRDDNDNIILNYNFDITFVEKSICIGKIFYVPINNKPIYTTFEIPDFILYKHAHHTNYTINGIKLNGGKYISDDIVCISLQETKVKDNRCYLECFSLYGNLASYNFYPFYLRNIVVNKELLYGIIWYPKTACTTIGNIFCIVNKIKIYKNNEKNLTYYRPKYRFNPFLQGIDFITFSRNPYHRFLSTFIDKHVYCDDLMYLNLDGYQSFFNNNKNTIVNLSKFISNKNYISDHYLPLHHFEGFQYIINKIKETSMQDTSLQEKNHTLNIYKIEDGLNKILFSFLSQYHKDIDLDILNIYKNSIFQKMTKLKDNKSSNLLEKKLSDYEMNEWSIHLKDNELNYEDILTDEIKDILYEHYKCDFELFNYSK